MTICYLSIGSNLKSPERQLRNSLKKINAIPKTQIISSSKIHLTLPHGINYWQPMYRNMAVAVKTYLKPLQLLNYCQSIERNMGRVRNIHWFSRTIDIDILTFGDKTIKNNRLTIPHPRMHERNFVLLPLSEITALQTIEK